MGQVDHRGLISFPFFERSGSVHAARLKQHGRRFPLCIFEMLTSTRRWRVPGFRVAFTYQWPDSPSGSATVWHACPLTVAWTVTRPRDGSWFPAFSGSRRMVDPSMAYVVASKRTAGTALA